MTSLTTSTTRYSSLTMVDDEPGDLWKAIEQLKELLKAEPDLHLRTDDNFYLRHLRAAEGDPLKAFDRIKSYYQHKRDYPDWYATEPPIKFKDVFEMACDYVLEDRDRSGKRIWINKPSKVDSSKTTLARQAQMHDLLLETILDEPETQKNGMAVIVDLKDFPWSLLRWLTPSNMKIASRKADLLPFPKLEHHVVNTSMFFNILFKMSYPFMSAKQKENACAQASIMETLQGGFFVLELSILYIHGDNWESLHKKVDQSVLPEEYGGPKPNVDASKLHNQIYAYTDKLLVNLNMGYAPNKDKSIKDAINEID